MYPAAYWAVKQHSRNRGNELLLLILLAEYVDRNGGGPLPVLESLSVDMRMTPKELTEVWHNAEVSGELVTYTHVDGSRWFHITLPDVKQPYRIVHNPRKAWDDLCSQQKRKIFVRIAARDGEQCRHCHTTANLCLDHIKPLSRGGTSTDDNLQLLCRSCNSKKKDRP